MEPQIRYVTSADGTRIAVSTLGQGRPLVLTHNIWTMSMEAYWQVPVVRDSYLRLAQRRMLVRFDHRGSGLSDRQVDDLSLDARVSDLSAVIDHIGATGVDLFATLTGGPIAIAFAVRHPEVAERLVLGDAVARGRDTKRTARHRALWPLIETDWEMFVRAQALADIGWDETGLAAGRARAESITAEAFLAAVRASAEYDVTELLPQVRCPTLVMHQRGIQIVSLETARRLATSIPNARLVQFEQDQVMMPSSEATVRLVEQFLDEDERPSPDKQSMQGVAQTGMTAILFADIADSTVLTERLGDAGFREKARELDTAMRTIIRDNSGTPIEGKLLGDGVLAVFTSARQAIAAALRCGRAGDEGGLPLHLGIHAGDVIREGDNVYGGAVNIASRIAGESAPGQLLVSETVRSLARTSAAVRFEDRGEQSLKGVGEPVRVWLVRPFDSPSAAAPGGSG